MTPEPRYVIGQDVYVRDPGRFVPGAVSITGYIQHVSQGRNRWIYRLRAYVAFYGRGEWIDVAYGQEQIGLRIGTPLSQLSGRPGHQGYDEFKRIASSYGYD